MITQECQGMWFHVGVSHGLKCWVHDAQGVIFRGHVVGAWESRTTWMKVLEFSWTFWEEACEDRSIFGHPNRKIYVFEGKQFAFGSFEHAQIDGCLVWSRFYIAPRGWK